MPQPISPERAARIRQLFEELSELPEGERSEFLDRACEDDQSLRHELTSLLRYADSVEAGFDDLAHDVVAPVLEALREDFAGLSTLLDQAAAQAEDGSSSWTGRRVSHFEINESIGRGGMGEVYRATDTRLNRDVAIKVLPEAFTSDPERLARFEREAKVLATLNHPSIGQIYGLEEAESTKALVLELVEGRTLADRIKRGPIPIEEALAIARQIADALEAAHEQGIIHRDLKPANVKVRDDGTVKVLDFGLAKVFEAGPEGAETQSPTVTEVTRPGIIMGTAAYMSPEQAKGKSIDKRSDVWAFGCVLYEMLTARRTFEGDSVSEIMAGVIKGDPDWDALPASLSPALVTYLKRCLEKDPRARIRDIGDVSLALRGAFDVSAPSASQLSVWQRPIPIVLAGLALIALTGLAVWAIKVGRTTEAPASAAVPLSRSTILLPESLQLPPNGGAIAVSPDGQTVVFAGLREDGSRQLFRRPIDHFAAEPMMDTEGGRDPFFSPDGQWVGFTATGVLRKVALAGGPSQKLAELPDGPGLRGGFWGDDGKLLLGRAPGLAEVPEEGGKLVMLLDKVVDDRRPEASPYYPQALPESGAILFTLSLHEPDGGDLQVLVPGKGERRTVLPKAAAGRVLPTGHLVFVREGALWGAPFDWERMEIAGDPVPVVEGLRVLRGGEVQYDVSESGTLVYLEAVPNPRGFGWKPDTDINLRHVM